MNDLKLSGSQTLGKGQYAGISSSGSLRIEGYISCESLSCSGSCKSSGNIACGGDVNISGSFCSDGKLRAHALRCSGSVSLAAFHGGDMKVSGNLTSSGAIEAEHMEIFGSLAAKSVVADSLKCSGAVVVPGQINADETDLVISHMAESKAGSIVGGKIHIRPSRVKKLFGSGSTRMDVDLIEGDDIEIDRINASVVRGARIRIGKECTIGKLEYSESANVASGAEVSETTKI